MSNNHAQFSIVKLIKFGIHSKENPQKSTDKKRLQKNVNTLLCLNLRVTKTALDV